MLQKNLDLIELLLQNDSIASSNFFNFFEYFLKYKNFLVFFNNNNFSKIFQHQQNFEDLIR